MVISNKILKQDTNTTESSQIDIFDKNKTNLNDDTTFDSITPHQQD